MMGAGIHPVEFTIQQMRKGSQGVPVITMAVRESPLDSVRG